MLRSTLLVLLCVTSPLTAQVEVTLRLAAVQDGAHATADAVIDAPRLRAGDGLEPALAAALRRGDWRIAVGVGRRTADLALRGEGSGILTVDALRAVTVGNELVRRMAVGSGAVSLGIGITRTRWTFPGLADPARWRWGVVASLESELPLAAHWALVGRVDAMRHGGVFDEDELPAGYQRTTPIRLGVGTGLRWLP